MYRYRTLRLFLLAALLLGSMGLWSDDQDVDLGPFYLLSVGALALCLVLHAGSHIRSTLAGRRREEMIAKCRSADRTLAEAERMDIPRDRLQ